MAISLKCAIQCVDGLIREGSKDAHILKQIIVWLGDYEGLLEQTPGIIAEMAKIKKSQSYYAASIKKIRADLQKYKDRYDSALETVQRVRNERDRWRDEANTMFTAFCSTSVDGESLLHREALISELYVRTAALENVAEKCMDRESLTQAVVVEMARIKEKNKL